MRSDGRNALKLDAVTPLVPNGLEKFLQQAILEEMSSLTDVTQGLLGKVLQGPLRCRAVVLVHSNVVST